MIKRQNKHIWAIWMENKKKSKKSFKSYLKNKMSKLEPERKYLSQSHIKKADSNLNFINFLI